jgi:hypothetical protein
LPDGFTEHVVAVADARVIPDDDWEQTIAHAKAANDELTPIAWSAGASSLGGRSEKARSGAREGTRAQSRGEPWS